MAYTDVTFDNRAFTSVEGVSVLKITPYLPAMRNINISAIARSNSAKVSSAFYTKKAILVRVGISRSTRRLAESALDNLMAIIQGQEKWLVVPQSIGYRKFLSTYSNYDVRVDGGAYIELDLNFECSEMFGYDNTPTTLLTLSGDTSAISSSSITLDGSAPWQIPKYTVTYSAISGGTGKVVTVGNGSTGQQVSIARDWLTGDVLIIDAYENTVTVNGIEVDFTGAIPTWEKGAGQITYQDNFTTRTYSSVLTYHKRWV